MPKVDKLTIKQELFIREYLICLNATEAAIKAWYSEKTAEAIGKENLHKPLIKAALDKVLAKRTDKLDITWEWVLYQLKELVEKCTQTKPIKKVVKYDKVIDEEDENGKVKKRTETEYKEEEVIWEFDSAGANSALDKLGKYFKLFTEWLDITSKGQQIGTQLTDKQRMAVEALRNMWL